MRVLVILEAEDVFIVALESWADFVHGESVGTEVNEGRVVGESEYGSSRVDSSGGVPAHEVRG